MSDTPFVRQVRAAVETAWREGAARVVDDDFDGEGEWLTLALLAIIGLPDDVLAGWLVETGRIEQPETRLGDRPWWVKDSTYGHQVISLDEEPELGPGQWDSAVPLYRFTKVAPDAE